jgi:hypothetical protein
MDDDGIRVVIEGEGEDAADSSTSRIAELNRQADADRAKTARLNLQTARMRREADLRSVDAARLTAESEARAAEAALKDADDMGDSDAKVAATRRLTAAEVRRSNLEMAHQQLQHAPISSGDPVEDRLTAFTDRTADWFRSHPEFLTDPRKNARAQGAHHMALSEGLVPDTDEYIAFCEKTLGIRGGGNGSRNGSGNMQRDRGSSKINPGDFNSHVTDDGRV